MYEEISRQSYNKLTSIPLKTNYKAISKQVIQNYRANYSKFLKPQLGCIQLPEKFCRCEVFKVHPFKGPCFTVPIRF